MRKSVCRWLISGLGVFLSVTPGNAQYAFQSTVFHALSVNVRDFPRVSVHILGLVKGQPLAVHDTSSGCGRWSVTLGSLPCSVSSCGPADPLNRVRLHVFADLDATTWGELLAIERVLTNLLTLPVVVDDVQFYTPNGQTFQTHNLLRFNQLKLSKKETPPLSIPAIEKFVIRNDSLFTHDLSVLIIIARRISAEDIARLGYLAASSRWVSPLHFGLFVEDPPSNTSTPRTDMVLFAEDARSVNRDTDDRLHQVFSALALAQTSLVITVPQMMVHEGSSLLGVRWTGSFAPNELQTSIRLEVPDTLNRRAVISRAFELSRTLSAQGQPGESLDTLASASRFVGKEPFLGAVDSLLQAYGRQLAGSGDSLALEHYVMRGEATWAKQGETWYRDLKADIVERLLVNLAPEALDRRVFLTGKLAELRGQDSGVLAQYYTLRSASRKQKGELWKAADDLATSLSLQPDATREKELIDVVREALTKSFGDGQFQEACRGGGRYERLLGSDFRLRFIVARSCQLSGDQKGAAAEYSWLVQNWRSDQQYLTWDEALRSLQALQSSNLQLDDAYRLSRRNYRQKGDEESLMSALGNLRAYALLPALGVYGSFAALAGGDPAALNRAKQQLGSKLPAYLRAFFTLEGSGKPSRVLGSGGAVPDNGLPAQKAGLVLDATKKTFWVYRRSAGNAVVAEFGTSLAGQENTIMADLRKNRMLEQPWKLFADLQIRSGARLLGELCAIVLYEQQRLKGGKIDFSGLESGLRENPAVLYVALYDKKGALLQSSGFDMSRCSADHVLWRKSTTTPAYLVQDVEYATIPALDVAAPVPGLRGGIVGVVKIGLKKQ